MIHKHKAPKYLLACLAALCFTNYIQQASASDTDGVLEGIGYREQALQVAKGSHFDAESGSGVSLASFGGGTNIWIQGTALSTDPQSNVVVFTSLDESLKGRQFIAPKLTEDDAFLSNPGAGTIVYRIPAPHILMGFPQKKLGTFEEMWFEISVLVLGVKGRKVLKCTD